jgi:hypothetical protein
MKRITSKLPFLAALLAVVLLLLPSAAMAAVAKAIDGSNAQRLQLPDDLVGPESVAFDAHGAGPYVSISDGRVLKYGGEGAGWKTFAFSPSYTKNRCDDFTELPAVATESSCGRPLGLRFHNDSGDLYIADAYMERRRCSRRRPVASHYALPTAWTSIRSPEMSTLPTVARRIHGRNIRWSPRLETRPDAS